MNRPVLITRGAWILLGFSAIIAGAGFALPRLRPVPTGVDAEIVAWRGERDTLATNDDATLEQLRQQSKTLPLVTWSAQKFTERVGTGWRVEWQQPDGASRMVRLSRSAPRLHEWPDYLRFLKLWTDQPGIVLESLDVSAKGAAQARELDQVVIGLRVALAVAPIGNAERDSPSLVPLPVAPAEGRQRPGRSGPAPRSAARLPPPSLRRPGRTPLRSVPTLRVPGPPIIHPSHNQQNHRTMITLTLQLPEPVAAEFYAAADKLNGRFPGASPKLEAKTLMAFALARHECADICAQFDLALRLIQGPPEPPFNPVLGQQFGRDSRPVPMQPAHQKEAA